MAKAVRVPSAPIQPPDNIVLTLSLGEATALRALLNNVEGPPSGPRGVYDNIKDVLALAAVPYVRVDMDLADGRYLYFTDKLPEEFK